MKSLRFVIGFAFCGACLLLGGGCAGTKSFLNWNREEVPEASAQNPVVRIIAIWEPAEGNGLDGLPTRGFAGQIMFFTAGESTPVRADGDVRIYLYDEQGNQTQRAKPLHQFDYINGAWTTHLRLGMLGPVYQVFVPYVRKHPYRARCVLRVRFKPKYGGPPVYSEAVTITLPGPTPPKKRQQQAKEGAPQGNQQLSVRRFSVPLSRAAEVTSQPHASVLARPSSGANFAAKPSPERVQQLLKRLQGHRLRPRRKTSPGQPSAAPTPVRTQVLSALRAPGPVVPQAAKSAGPLTTSQGKLPGAGSSEPANTLGARRFQLRPAGTP